MSRSPQPPEKSILLTRPTNGVYGIYAGIKENNLFLLCVAFMALLSEFLPLLLANIPYNLTQTERTHEVCARITLVIIGLQSGAVAELNLAVLLSRRLTIAGTTLRSRPLEQRAAIVADVRSTVWPLVPSKVRPVIHEVFELEDVAAAHRLMEEREAFGKVVLKVG